MGGEKKRRRKDRGQSRGSMRLDEEKEKVTTARGELLGRRREGEGGSRGVSKRGDNDGEGGGER